MNRLIKTALYMLIPITMLGISKVALSAEVKQPLSTPQVYTLSDGTRCIRWYGDLQCDFKHGELVRELKYLYGYIGSLQAELKKRKYLNS